MTQHFKGDYCALSSKGNDVVSGQFYYIHFDSYSKYLQFISSFIWHKPQNISLS